MKNWSPDIPRLNALAAQVQAGNPAIVLDIGANTHYRFPAATHTVGWQADIPLDLCRDPLPFADQSVNFVFCRHTIEDLADPTHLLAEISRVAVAGYIETPSPLAELTRGIDAIGDHLGYIHHRWICWHSRGVFRCLAKYPVVERMQLPSHWDQLQRFPELWNSSFQWTGRLAFKVLQNECGFHLGPSDERGVRPQYEDLLLGAIADSRREYQP